LRGVGKLEGCGVARGNKCSLTHGSTITRGADCVLDADQAQP
jgi:hypothetical protein